MKEIYNQEYKDKAYRIIANYSADDKEDMFIFERSTGKDALGDYNWDRIAFVTFILPLNEKTPDYDRIVEIMAYIKDSQWKWISMKDSSIIEEED